MCESAPACSGIAEMSHEDLCLVPKVDVDMLEHLSDGILAEGTFTKHVFLAWLGIEVGTGYASSFLPSVVLLLHHQIEFVEGIRRCAVLLLIVSDGLEQTYHCHTTFVFEWFHISFLLLNDFPYSLDGCMAVVACSEGCDADISLTMRAEPLAWGDYYVGIGEQATKEVPGVLAVGSGYPDVGRMLSPINGKSHVGKTASRAPSGE